MQKPIVQIKDCFILPDGTNQILTGIPIDYPDEHQYYPGALENGKRVFTSAIVSVDGDTVETSRTIYKVQNWLNQE